MSLEFTEMARRFEEIHDAVARISRAAEESAERETNVATSIQSVLERVYRIEEIFGVFTAFTENITNLLIEMSGTLPGVRDLEEQIRSALGGVEELRRTNDEAISGARTLLTEFRQDVSELATKLTESNAHVELMSKSHIRMEQRMNDVESSLSRIRAEIPRISEHVASADKSAFALATSGTAVNESSLKVAKIAGSLESRIDTFDQASKDVKRQVSEVSRALETLPGVIDDVSRQATVDIAMQIMRDLDFSALLEGATREIVTSVSSRLTEVTDVVHRVNGRITAIEEALSNRRGVFGSKK